MTDAERVASTERLLLEAFREARAWVSGDSREGLQAAADLLGWSVSTISKRIGAGTAPPHDRIGRRDHRLTFALVDLAGWIERHRVDRSLPATPATYRVRSTFRAARGHHPRHDQHTQSRGDGIPRKHPSELHAATGRRTRRPPRSSSTHREAVRQRFVCHPRGRGCSVWFRRRVGRGDNGTKWPRRRYGPPARGHRNNAARAGAAVGRRTTTRGRCGSSRQPGRSTASPAFSIRSCMKGNGET